MGGGESVITIGNIVDAMDRIAPFSGALDFDNAGLLVGERDTVVQRVLLALDITAQVIGEAEELGAQLILSHHPVIFHPLRTLEPQSVPYQLAKKGIAALCCHTNLDLSPEWGTNIALAKRLELQNVKGELPCAEGYLLYSGELPKACSPLDFARFTRERLSCEALRFYPGEGPVRRVFFCTGAGGEYLLPAAQKGADAFVTGEVRHHEALLAASLGITVLEAGHYETERPFEELLSSYLQKQFPEIQFFCSQRERPPLLGLSGE